MDQLLFHSLLRWRCQLKWTSNFEYQETTSSGLHWTSMHDWSSASGKLSFITHCLMKAYRQSHCFKESLLVMLKLDLKSGLSYGYLTGVKWNQWSGKFNAFSTKQTVLLTSQQKSSLPDYFVNVWWIDRLFPEVIFISYNDGVWALVRETIRWQLANAVQMHTECSSTDTFYCIRNVIQLGWCSTYQIVLEIASIHLYFVWQSLCNLFCWLSAIGSWPVDGRLDHLNTSTTLVCNFLKYTVSVLVIMERVYPFWIGVANC